jgi:hypothetical protein
MRAATRQIHARETNQAAKFSALIERCNVPLTIPNLTFSS